MSERLVHQKSLPKLPSLVTTQDGVNFDPRESIWLVSDLRSAESLRFDEFHRLSAQLVLNLKWGTLTSLQNKSLAHVRNQYHTFKSFYRSVLEKSDEVQHRITLNHILKFKALLNRTTEWKLGIIRILLSNLDDLGFGITSEEAIQYLGSSTIRGNIKGTATRTRDPEKGAFNDAEILTIQSALNQAYASGKIDLNAFAITWLFLAYGPRAIQIAALKEKDLVVSSNERGRFYALRMPRAKQRGEKARDSFKTRYCGKQVGILLEQVIKTNRRRRRELGLSKEDSPMFIADKEGALPYLRYHMTSARIGRIVGSTIGPLIGLKTNAQRFRSTLAQSAVDDGKDKHTVAELLDHSDTQNVGVYYEASPSMVLRLDRHLAMEMAPLAQAFAGVVVVTEQDARRGGDRSSRIFDRSLSNGSSEALGTCGQMSFCGLAAPFACYTCRHFQPWLDGPHDEFMGTLIADRERMEAEGYSSKIYTIRDRTILAVAEVIQLCAVENELRTEVVA